MSLFTTPVTVSDIAQLELGIQQFTTSAQNEANIVAAINAPNGLGNSTTTVNSYANQLLNGALQTSQVMMGVVSLISGQTPSEAAKIGYSTVVLPPQIQFAQANNFDPAIVAGEALGAAFANNAFFQSNFVRRTLLTRFRSKPVAFPSNLFSITSFSGRTPTPPNSLLA
jgi:hypothetical protein